MKRVLVVRPDGMGDVLLCGPAIRAIATEASVALLCSAAGARAGARLPGVEHCIVRGLEWIDADPQPVDPARFQRLVDVVRDGCFDEAIVMTSFHQSPLPTALLLRLAGVERIGAISVDYPGSLLDVRHLVSDDLHEVERGLSLAHSMGYSLAAGDDDRMRVTLTIDERATEPYVVVHPGSSAPARTLRPAAWRNAVAFLAARGRNVVVTGSRAETELVAFVAGDAPGDTVRAVVSDDFDWLARVIADADAIAVGNTGPAHLAAATGTPVVSVFAPTVPASKWAPWRVPRMLLGDQTVGCAGCRARTCPHAVQTCLAGVHAPDIADAVDAIATVRAGAAAAEPGAAA